MKSQHRNQPTGAVFLESFQLLVENLNEVFWIRSPDLRELYYVSPAFERIWGRPVSDLYDQPTRWAEFVIAEDRPRVAAAFAAFVSEDRPLDLEYRIVRPDGGVRWVHVRGAKARDAAGQPIRLVGIVSDITEQRRAEQALRESEADVRLRTRALDAAANAVAITDARGDIQWVNEAFTALTGYAATEVIGQNLRLLKSGQHPDSLYQQMWRSLSRGEVWQGELVNRRKDGGLYHEEMTITPLHAPDGAISHYIAIKLDITARKQSEAAIQELHRKLVVASRQAGMADVAIDILHNVGNALNSVRVSTNLLAEHLRDSRVATLGKLAELLRAHEPDLARYLTTDPSGVKVPALVEMLAATLAAERTVMLAEVANAHKYLEDVTETVRRQESLTKASWVTETFAVADLVEEALRINVDALTGHDIEIIRDVPAQPPLTTDRHKVMQILINLVRNARQACERSGRADKRITARATRDGDRVRIAVIDNGVGFAAEDLPRMFGPDLPSRTSGFGSGLHSDASAASQLGGTLRGESAGPGQGATFTLEIPSQTT